MRDAVCRYSATVLGNQRIPKEVMNRLMIFLFWGLGIGLMLDSNSIFSQRFLIPAKNEALFGKIQFARVESHDDFSTIAQRYHVGFYELVDSNPKVDPDHPTPGTVLVIPSQYLLPEIKRTGIIINLAAMRLYYFPENKKYFYTYPIGIGRENWNTPLGALRIIQKIKDPVWIVPDSVREYREKNNDPVPKRMPAGPNNPLGKFALRLSVPTYLIHGTNDPSSVGRRSSAGCIHLYPEDIEELYAMVPLKTRVFIINQPYIAGLHRGKFYIEAHLPLREQRDQLSNSNAVIAELITPLPKTDQLSVIDWDRATEVLKEHVGVPIPISKTLTQARD